MKLSFLLVFFCLISGSVIAQSEVYALYDALFENTGYWKDNIIYDKGGKPLMVVRGDAVIDKKGSIAGWTDHAGILFGRDGQMTGYTVQLNRNQLNQLTLDPDTSGFISQPLKNVFTPVLCYDFIPLENNEEIVRADVIRREEYLNPGNSVNRMNNDIAKLNESMADVNDKMASIVSRNNDVSGLLKSLPGGNNITTTQTTASANLERPEKYRRDAEDYKDKAKEIRNDNVKRIGDTYNSRDTAFIFPQQTLKLRLSNRVFKSGDLLKTQDSVKLQHFPLGTPSNRPSIIDVYAYNIRNKAFENADKSYAIAHSYLDSAYKYYDLGEYDIAIQYAGNATRKRSNYVNAHLLAVTGAKMFGNYELGLSLLDGLKQESYKGIVEALRAELFFLMGDKEKSENLLQKSLKDGAKDWSEFIRHKYNIVKTKS